MAAFALRSKIKSSEMEDIIENANNVDELIDKELKLLGVTPENKEAFVTELGLSDPKDILRELTKKRYDEERKGLIGRINERFDKISKSSEEENMKAVGKSLTSSVEEYKQLLHFNNVVSSYLSIRSPSGEETRNTKALMMELADNAFDGLEDMPEEEEGNNNWGRVDYKTGEKLLEMGNNTQSTDHLPVLSPEQVNQLLGTDTGNARDDSARP